jgi:hypothetical protein
MPASTRVSDDSPSISGPSFLGLNDPAPRKRGSLSFDHSSPSSSNVDYLLDDEEEHRRGGAGKIVLILVALALAAGLGYLRWKNHGFGWLGSTSNKPSAVAQDSGSTDTVPPGTTAPTTAEPPATAASQPVSGPPATQPDSASSPANSAATGTPANPVTSAPSGGTPANAQPATSTAPPSPENAAPAAPKEPAPDTTDSANTPAAKEPEPKAAKPTPAAKPPAAIRPTPAPPIDTVAEARKYLYGKGAAQDCERGLRLLKPAANQSNPKAMIEMGALYSAGLCTPHDLPTAYRWFALALRKDPENVAVQADLQKLWGEMTQPERQLAIKLSQ